MLLLQKTVLLFSYNCFWGTPGGADFALFTVELYGLIGAYTDKVLFLSAELCYRL